MAFSKDKNRLERERNKQDNVDLANEDPFIQFAKDDPYLPADYNLYKDEQYMSPLMLAYFKRKLMAWRDDLLQDTKQGMYSVEDQVPREPDNVDRAALERNRDDEIQKLNLDENLLHQIDEAIERIHNGSYGFCEDTGEPIGIERLEVWPIAALTIESQKRREELSKTTKV